MEQNIHLELNPVEESVKQAPRSSLYNRLGQTVRQVFPNSMMDRLSFKPKKALVNTIYWLRHAESCANLLENKIVDTYSNSKLKEAHHNLFKRYAEEHRYFDDNGNVNESDPSLPSDLVGILQSISGVILTPTNSPATSPFGKTIVTVDEKGETKTEVGIFKGPESRWLFHPPLSSVGEKQAMKLKDQYAFSGDGGVVSKCNVFITSATVRTIMTAIYSLNGKTVTLYVVPCINEKMNESSEYGLDFVNTGIPKDKIDEIIDCVIKYVEPTLRGGWSPFSKPKTSLETTLKTSHPIGTITIDTSFYHKCPHFPATTTKGKPKTEEANKEILTNSIEMFKKDVIGKLAKHIDIKFGMNILAYSHGYVINNLLDYYGYDKKKRPKYAPNVSMYEEDMVNKTIRAVPMDDTTNPYGGVFVRQGSSAISSDDNYDSPPKPNSPNPNSQENLSPCSLFGFRGDINRILLRDYKPVNGTLSKGGGRSTRKYKPRTIRRKKKPSRRKTRRS